MISATFVKKINLLTKTETSVSFKDFNAMIDFLNKHELDLVQHKDGKVLAFKNHIFNNEPALILKDIQGMSEAENNMMLTD